MDGATGDEAARVFAVRLYGALGNRRSVGNAVAIGERPSSLPPSCAIAGFAGRWEVVALDIRFLVRGSYRYFDERDV